MHKITLVLFSFFISAGFAQDFRFGKVSKEELQEKAHPTDAEADAAILFRNQYSHIDYTQNEGFVLTTEVHERIKIYNEEGFGWATRKIPLYVGGSTKENISGLKGKTYTLQNGKIVETKLRNDGIFKEESSKYYQSEKFTMPNLKAGCVIEFKYKFYSPFLSGIDEIRLQEEIPLNKAEVTFVSPEWLVYQLHRKGLMDLDINEKSNPAKINYRVRVGADDNGLRGHNRGTIQNETIDLINKGYEILVEDVPAMKDEAFSSNIDNYRSAINFELSYTKYPGETIETITSNWEAVSKTIYDSDNFGGQLRNDRFFDDDIDMVLEGVTDSQEKIVRIFEYVKLKMNWNGYLGIYADEGVKSAYKERVGNSADINLLLIGMLRYANLDANPVILSTRENGIPVYPTRNGFNHVIAGVTLDGQTHLMDATNKLGAVDLLEEGLLNWNGRLIREDGSSTWISLYPKKHAVESTMINAEIDEDLSLKSSAKTRYTGHYGLANRSRHKGKSNQESLEALEKIHSGIEISEVELTNLDNVYEPVELSYSFEMLNGVEDIGGKLYLSPLFHLATQENPFKSEERQHPVDFRYPWMDRYIIVIKVPEGYKVESMPESGIFTLAEKQGTFKYLISNKGGAIQVSTEMAINTSIITPNLYQDLKKFYQMVVAKENEKIVLSKI